VNHPLDSTARAVFTKALADNRAGETLERLFDGDSVTIDATTGDLMFMPAAQLSLLGGDAA
jgi:hypothetical protein